MKFLLLLVCLALVSSGLAIAVCEGQAEGSPCEGSGGKTGTCINGACSFQCGNGNIEKELGEQCDPPNRECCGLNCRFLIGTECRPANGSCDIPESCNGRHHYCPADVHVADDTYCPLPGHIHPGVCKAGKCVKPHEKDEYYDDVIIHRHFHHGKHSDAVAAAEKRRQQAESQKRPAV